MIQGIGIDVVDMKRMEELVGRWGDRFLTKVFTDSELAYARSKKNAIPHFAGRFAVKEAVAKAMATGWAGGFRWKDVEVRNDPSGKPSVLLHGRMKELLAENTVHITLSHSEAVIVACAVIENTGLSIR